jgi:hypothetical protein
MNRAHVLAIAFAFLLGCASPGERTQLKPLPEDNQPVPYAELLTRARQQSAAATEAFYVNKWADLEDAAKGIEQTARYLTKASDVPVKLRDSLPVLAGDLAKEAGKLNEAARARDVQKVNESQQRIHLKVRELRIE